MAILRSVFTHLYSDLPRGDEIRSHVRALAHMAEAPEHQQELFDHLYGCLSILDSKASALLTFDSIITAVFAIFFTQSTSAVERGIINVGMISVLLSSFLLLLVVWVHWSSTSHLTDYDKHADTLLGVRRGRTIKYRLAWDFAVLAILLLFVLVVVKLMVGQ